ncbi:hypothetical protein EYF88_10900 [Paracoccus sediminis]|uniref:Uncharacterized protein n=1 Tax=Paracoccus sediminis TaxID=1214787 RepID=A0A238WXP6_9RHOB|nr:hypothetical protein [Paracoccus sediminis]TBN50120.1 hypothetical protein EYF88_10900 [Paracoccus sediminis]SNR51296.1 hypothetical protein SAMN06265378_106194 [Paracoccus sediminis]
MGTLAVGSLALSLRLPGGAQNRAGAVQKVVERQFLPAVLDAMACELDAIYGDAAVIRIRSLTIRLRIGPEIRNAADLARQIGQDLAAHIHDIAIIAHPASPPPPAAAEARIWPTAGAWHGAALIAALRGEPGPEGCADDLPGLARTLLAEPADVIAATLGHCADAGVMDEVVSALPPSGLHMLVARSATALPPAIRARILAATERTGAQGPAPAHQAEADPARDAPAHQRPSDSADPARPPRDETSPSRRQPEACAPDPDPLPDGAPHPYPILRPGTAADPAAAQAAKAFVPRPPAKRTTLPFGNPAPARQTIPDLKTAPPPERIGAGAQPPSNLIPTRWGGLVYLVTLAVRLGMPEALWRIGVSEGEALSAMLATISKAPDDPVSAVLAPEFPRPPAPLGPVPDWARRDFCAAIATAARDLTGTDLSARIETFQAALAEDCSWHLPEWGAAVLVATLAEMIDRPLDAGALAGLLGIAGEIGIGARLVRVRLPSDAIDFDIRRTGLDANPGFLPWLDKRLEIEFGSGEGDWAG